jgi:type IV secretion system protein VirB1
VKGDLLAYVCQRVGTGGVIAGAVLVVGSAVADGGATRITGEAPRAWAMLSFQALASTCAPSVHVRTLSAVVRAESAVHPYAIHINGRRSLSRHPSTERDAVDLAEKLLGRGERIDVGLGQISSGNVKRLGLSLEQAFNPCENLRAAALVLTSCYERGVAVFGEGQAALHAALSCYNTGSLVNGFKNGYVRRVVAKAALPVPELLAAPSAAPGPATTLEAPRQRGPAEPTAPKRQETMVARADPPSAGEQDVFSAATDVDAFAKGWGRDPHERSKLDF